MPLISASSFAQHDFSLKLLPKIDFNSGKLQSDSTNFSFDFNKVQPNFKQYFLQKQEAKTWSNSFVYQSNMPIATPGNCQLNMPIVAPDSTINDAH